MYSKQEPMFESNKKIMGAIWGLILGVVFALILYAFTETLSDLEGDYWLFEVVSMIVIPLACAYLGYRHYSSLEGYD
jgi:uncharacterized membrane protein YgaE (UPF0421/DUF939 family)